MVDEEYSQEDQVQDSMDAQEEYQDSMTDSLDANYPIQKEQQSLYTLFKWVIQKKDTSKIGNLLKQELGDHSITVRDAQHLSELGKIFSNPAYEDYFKQHAEITLATSLSRDGFLDTLFVSQKKESTKSRKSSTPLTQEKWKIFNRNKQAQ